MILLTAKDFISRFSLIEIGQLLTNSGDSLKNRSNRRDDFVQDIYDTGDESGNVKEDVKKDLRRHIDSAESITEAMISNRYVVPLFDQENELILTTDQVPEQLKDVVANIARWYLNDRILGEFDIVTRRYEDSMNFLKKLSEGDANLITSIQLKEVGIRDAEGNKEVLYAI